MNKRTFQKLGWKATVLPVTICLLFIISTLTTVYALDSSPTPTPRPPELRVSTITNGHITYYPKSPINGILWLPPGSNLTITYSADIGYIVESVDVDGLLVPITGSVTFINIQSNHLITILSSPSPSSTPSPTASPTPTSSPTPTPSPTPTTSPTPSPTPIATLTASTATPNPTSTSTATETPTSTATPFPTPTITSTTSAPPSNSIATPTPTPTQTAVVESGIPLMYVAVIVVVILMSTIMTLFALKYVRKRPNLA